MDKKRNITDNCTLDCNEIYFPINLLPDEMLLKIFSYLQVDDICFSITAVCKRWNSLSTASLLWKSKWLTCGNYMPYISIKHILSNAPLLQAIELQWRTDVNLIVEDLNNFCKKINHVNLVCCGNLRTVTIDNLCTNYPLLEHLSLEKCWAVQDSCYDALHNFINLKSLNISHSKYFSGKTLKDVVDFCPSLLHINIDYVRGITDNDLLYLLQKRGCNLISLVIFGECLTDLSFCYLEKCKKLKKLHISRCHMMSKTALKSIGNLSNLCSLKLRFGSNLSSEDLNIFLYSKAVWDLKYLCLSRSENFTDESAAAIADNCKKLRQLDVMFCPNLTETGRQILLSKCSQLQIFNFSEDIFLGGIML